MASAVSERVVIETTSVLLVKDALVFSVDLVFSGALEQFSLGD